MIHYLHLGLCALLEQSSITPTKFVKSCVIMSNKDETRPILESDQLKILCEND